MLLFVFFSILLFRAEWARGQTSITAQTATLTNNFNSYNPSVAGNVPSTITSTDVLSGMSGSGWAASSSITATYNGQGTGTTTAGGYWGYGSAGNFSLGALRSGTPGDITYTLTFTNNTGSPITSVTLGWDYKQFRFASTTSGWNCTGSGFGATANATVNSKDFVGTNTGTNGTPVTTTIASFTLNNLAIANGASFSISWLAAAGSSGGSNNGISIDNFSIQTVAGAYLSLSGTPTDHGSACVGTSATPVTYTVTNIGLATATGLAVTSNDPQFVVSGLSSTSLAPGASATYTVTFTPTSAGAKSATITATSTAADSNSPTMSLTGTGIALPAPTISGTTSVCVGANTTLTPSIAGGEWSSGTPANASIDATGVVLGLAAGTSVMTYTVTVTGCVGTTTSTVTVDPLPTLTIANPATVCTPSTVDITTAAVQTTNTGTTTKYYNGYALALAGGASNVSTPSAIASAGTYYIRSELATGCYVIQPVTVTINQSPSFAPLVTQPTCLTNGSITFAELSPGTYTYSYTINGGASTPVSPSGGNVTISVPMGVQVASTYAVTATRTDITPNCSYTVSNSIAAITFCITPTAQVADPCTCNNNQATDGSQTGTFNETVVVNGSGPGQTWTVATIAPLVAGTAPTLAVNTVLSAVLNSGANGIDDDGDGSTDEPDEAYIYSVSFVHTDDAGYTATIEGPAALGTGGNQTLSIANRCQYPEIIFGANPAASYCVASGAMPSVALSVTEANSMAGTATFSGTGVSGTTFAPTGGGTYTVTAVYQSTAGTGKGGTVGAPATAANACYTTESKTTTVTDSRCGTFPQ